MPVIWLLIWIPIVIALAFWPARVATRKGHSFLGYFVLSLFFFPLALIMAYVVPERDSRNRDTSHGWMNGCGPGWVRVTASTSALVALFYLLPMDHDRGVSPIVLLAIALGVIAVVAALQIRAIINSPLPAAKAVEALAASIPPLILSYASAYYLMSQADPEAFTQSLARTRALYFTMSVFSTVGFGDITPSTDAIRLVVSAQMALDLLVLGVGLKLIFGAIQIGRERQAKAASDTPVRSTEPRATSDVR